MRIFCTLARRELAAFFCSLTGYVIIAAVTLLTGLSFVMLMRNLGTDPFSMPVTELFFNSLLVLGHCHPGHPDHHHENVCPGKGLGHLRNVDDDPGDGLRGGGGQIHDRGGFLHGDVAADPGRPVHRAAFYQSNRARWTPARWGECIKAVGLKA